MPRPLAEVSQELDNLVEQLRILGRKIEKGKEPKKEGEPDEFFLILEQIKQTVGQERGRWPQIMLRIGIRTQRLVEAIIRQAGRPDEN